MGEIKSENDDSIQANSEFIFDQMSTGNTEIVQSTNKSSKKNRKYKNQKSSQSNKVDVKAKLERSRQSARECRARKKLRYQYLEDLVRKRENANNTLNAELEQVNNFTVEDLFKDYIFPL